MRSTAAVLVASTVACLTCACATTRSGEQPPRFVAERSSCAAALPDAWRHAFSDGDLATGGSSTTQAVGPAGDVAAVRDNGETRDLLLIGPDRSITVAHTVPDPDADDVEFATMSDVALNDRWIVVGVSSELGENGSRPYVENGTATAVNGAGPKLNRLDVVDRRDGSVRTIVSTTAAERRRGTQTLDSIALFSDTVYWITRDDTVHPGEGIMRSFDLETGAANDEEAGSIHAVHATPVGIAWSADGDDFPVRTLSPLPDDVASSPGIAEDQATLAGDGTNFAWITGLAQGGTGIAWWSPESGVTHVSTGKLFGADGTSADPPPIYVDGPLVAIGRRFDSAASILDTRSGAIAELNDSVAGAGGGTIATQSSAPGVAPFIPRVTGLVRADALPPLSC